jgi:hypothetical protein
MTPVEIDAVGRIYGLTWPTPIRHWGRPWLRMLFWAARHVPLVSAPLRRMAMVRGAYWTILTHVPDGEGHRRRLRRPVLFFEASFDVDLYRYIEVFAEAIRWRFRFLWGSGVGYPGVLPAEGFLAWVHENRANPSHYWCAYPDSTTHMVGSALRVAEQLSDFDAKVAALDDKAFAAAFDRLLTATAKEL